MIEVGYNGRGLVFAGKCRGNIPTVMPQRVVVLGGGYGGLGAALYLDRRLSRRPAAGHELVLVDRADRHSLIIRLHEVAAGSAALQDVQIPFQDILRGRNIRFVQAEVTDLDLEASRVFLNGRPVEFDRLVVALGSVTETFQIPGLDRGALRVRSPEEALAVRAHLEAVLGQAARERDPERRQRLQTVLVGGTGYTGTELAAELAARLPAHAARFGLPADGPQVVALEADAQVLPGFPAALADRAARGLRRQGVRLRLSACVEALDGGWVVLATGERIGCGTVIWTGGVRAPDILAASGLQTGARGRAAVDEFLQSASHPRVSVIGDCAWALDPWTRRSLPPSAQLSLQQAERVGWNLYAELMGLRRLPFRPFSLGDVISLGPQDAVARIGPAVITGPAARALKDSINERYVAGLIGRHAAHAFCRRSVGLLETCPALLDHGA